MSKVKWSLYYNYKLKRQDSKELRKALRETGVLVIKDGTFSYYVAPGTIKEGSKVTMEAYGEGDILLAKNFPVLIQP